MKPRITIKQLAQACDLSPMATSYAVRGQKEVSQETIRRVQAVAKKLGYVPDMQARGLRVGRSGLIGLVLPDETIDASHLKACIHEVRSRGYELVLLAAEKKEDLGRTMELKCIEGALLIGGASKLKTEIPCIHTTGPELKYAARELLAALKR